VPGRALEDLREWEADPPGFLLGGSFARAKARGSLPGVLRAACREVSEREG